MVLWNRSQMPLVCGDLTFVLVCSMSPLSECGAFACRAAIDGKEQLVIMLVCTTTILGSPVCQNSEHRQIVLLVKWQHLVVQHVSSGDRCFGRIQPGMGNLGLGVHIGLLVNAPNTLHGAHVECILRAKVAGLSGMLTCPAGNRCAVSISPQASSSSFFFPNA